MAKIEVFHEAHVRTRISCERDEAITLLFLSNTTLIHCVHLAHSYHNHLTLLKRRHTKCTLHGETGQEIQSINLTLMVLPLKRTVFWSFMMLFDMLTLTEPSSKIS